MGPGSDVGSLLALLFAAGCWLLLPLLLPPPLPPLPLLLESTSRLRQAYA